MTHIPSTRTVMTSFPSRSCGGATGRLQGRDHASFVCADPRGEALSGCRGAIGPGGNRGGGGHTGVLGYTTLHPSTGRPRLGLRDVSGTRVVYPGRATAARGARCAGPAADRRPAERAATASASGRHRPRPWVLRPSTTPGVPDPRQTVSSRPAPRFQRHREGRPRLDVRVRVHRVPRPGHGVELGRALGAEIVPESVGHGAHADRYRGVVGAEGR